VGLPRLWRFLDALPVNAQGKTSHADLLALLETAPALVTEPQSRLLERDAEHAVFELIAPDDLVYFNGHFYGQPILAGVVQVDWAIAYGRRCFDLPPLFRAIQMLKFQRLIVPDTPFRLELVYQSVSATLSFKISTALGTHASGRLLFGAADD
jgi:3-hydroxymyristoyl/3-hydroxydecanoyl-(acyl carrier protein) dehydratase